MDAGNDPILINLSILIIFYCQCFQYLGMVERKNCEFIIYNAHKRACPSRSKVDATLFPATDHSNFCP